MEQLASDTSSFEGGPPFSAEPHGWGISMSVSGEFQRARSLLIRDGSTSHKWEADRMQAAYFLERLGYLRFDAEASRAKLYVNLQRVVNTKNRNGQETCAASR